MSGFIADLIDFFAPWQKPQRSVLIWELPTVASESSRFALVQSIDIVFRTDLRFSSAWEGGDHRERPGEPYYPQLCSVHRYRATHWRCCQGMLIVRSGSREFAGNCTGKIIENVVDRLTLI